MSVGAIEVVVDATDACGKRARIVDLPTTTLGPANVEGADIFDYFSPDGGVLDASETDGTWAVGDTARFRLASSECRLEAGDRIAVRVVHLPSGQVIVAETLTAS